MTLQDICKIDEFDLSHVALVRHNLTNKVVRKSFEEGELGVYQEIQKDNRFGKYDYILSFLGEEGTASRFLGCYQVCGKAPLDIDSIPEYIQNDIKEETGLVRWILKETDRLAEYKDRLIIDWGRGAINWLQRGTTTKDVLAIEPAVSEITFESYDKVLLSYEALQTIVNNSKQHSTWKKELSRVAAIYLIADRKTGKLYVGSATGENDGLWGRWSTYAKTGHGGNKELMLLTNAADYARNLQFSILKVFPLKHDPYDILKYEKLYKEKLLSIQFGLNDN